MSVTFPRNEVIEVGELAIRVSDGLVRVGRASLVLSGREFALLLAFARADGRILSREQLYREMRGGPLAKDDLSVDDYMHKLQVKLEAACPGVRFIHTHFGFGYRLAPDRSQLFHNSVTAS